MSPLTNSFISSSSSSINQIPSQIDLAPAADGKYTMLKTAARVTVCALIGLVIGAVMVALGAVVGGLLAPVIGFLLPLLAMIIILLLGGLVLPIFVVFIVTPPNFLTKTYTYLALAITKLPVAAIPVGIMAGAAVGAICGIAAVVFTIKKGMEKDSTGNYVIWP